jgi:ABC-type amino acid transport substrate-binding protein
MKEESMLRTFGLAVSLVAAVLFGVAGPGSAAPKKLAGTVGPGFTISVKLSGAPVTKLKGGQYRLVVSDRSSIHDFHLTGPGVNKVVTSVPYTGTKAVLLTLKKGVYTFVCDPHASVMHGSFRVG